MSLGDSISHFCRKYKNLLAIFVLVFLCISYLVTMVMYMKVLMNNHVTHTNHRYNVPPVQIKSTSYQCRRLFHPGDT
jgi:hypothetical protein